MVKSRKASGQRATTPALTVGGIIKRLLPNGTKVIPQSPSWQECPEWPGDVFAAAAAVVHASSCYAELGVALSRNDRERKLKAARAKLHIDTGKEWAKTGETPSLVRQHWATLYKAFDLTIDDEDRPTWKHAALALVALSDEAFAGSGFFPAENDGFANYVWAELVALKNKMGKVALQLPHSMALLVPSEIACILPKSLTPNVGCTLRSLTHHLAYLPGRTIVDPLWRYNPAGGEVNRLIGDSPTSGRREATPDGVFNILLIPFPYVVFAQDFRVERVGRKDSDGNKSDGYFSITQDWLSDDGKRLTAGAMAKFIGDLIRNAEQDAGLVHAVVLPEVALDERLAKGVARILARQFRGLELLVTGIVTEGKDGPRNVAAQYSMMRGKVPLSVHQSKHHRWRLEENQIRRYQLGGVLDPNFNWWEDIDVFGRQIGFSTNRDDAIIAALVCEDLARYDPVLPVVAAVGPTLVIALLLDGPQLPNRWPGRYATVLAEDPGSAVLTLTNLGMIERSALPGEENKAVVGLWKESQGSAQELTLPNGHHGLVLSLNCCEKHQVTLDHRRASKPTIEYRLGAIRPVRLKKPPKWLERTADRA